MKKAGEVLACLLALIFIACLTSACTGSLNDGIFLYKVTKYGDEKQIIILGLTEKGKEQEYLLIPEEIDGIRVTCIDGMAESKTVKKLYIPSNIVSVNNRLNSIMSERNSFITGNDSYKCIFFHKVYGPYLISGGVDCYYQENAVYESRYILSSHAPKTANVHFYKNAGEDEDVYFLDDLDIGEGFGFVPPVPKREGYVFVSWCLDKEGNAPFSFDGYVKEDESILRLYASWQQA